MKLKDGFAEMKISIENYQLWKDGIKHYEVRQEVEFAFQKGMWVRIQEWSQFTGYTGREIKGKISNVYRGPYLSPRCCIFSLSLITMD